eukprot:767118-Hanusia_phi.AAC.1
MSNIRLQPAMAEVTGQGSGPCMIGLLLRLSSSEVGTDGRPLAMSAASSLSVLLLSSLPHRVRPVASVPRPLPRSFALGSSEFAGDFNHIVSKPRGRDGQEGEKEAANERASKENGQEPKRKSAGKGVCGSRPGTG